MTFEKVLPWLSTRSASENPLLSTRILAGPSNPEHNCISTSIFLTCCDGLVMFNSPALEHQRQLFSTVPSSPENPPPHARTNGCMIRSRFKAHLSGEYRPIIWSL